MCGLFGIVRNDLITNDKADWLASVVTTELEIAMSERGTDSWGYMTAGEGYESIARGIGCMVPASGNRRTPLAPIMLGHTRHATHGQITIANQHPYEYGDIALMHNGVIYNAPHKYIVDSEVLADRVSQRETVGDLRGYGTVQWLEDNEAYICRMSRGDLDVAWVSSIKNQCRFLIWSSNLQQSFKVIKAVAPDVTFRLQPTLPEGRVYRICKDTLTLRRVDYEMNLQHSLGKAWYEFGTASTQTLKSSPKPKSYTYTVDGGWNWQDEYATPVPITGPWALGDD